jgi:hypothetical protein
MKGGRFNACPKGWVSGLAAILVSVLAVGAASADEQPSAAMLKPVRELATFMSTLPRDAHAGMFAGHGVCIVENFAPYVFSGAYAAARWEQGFRAHAAGLTELVATFDAAHDFSQTGDRAYFSLPTTWTGLDAGRRFEEHGAWAFVLQRTGTARAVRWRILSYGWGVTAYTESP